MATLRDALLPVIERLRGIPGQLGLRVYTSVSIIVRTWSGDNVGEGTVTDVETPILVYGQPPRVREISTEDIAASGGLYEQGDIDVGPITPAFAGGGVDVATIDPSYVGPNVEIFWKLTGPGGDEYCNKVHTKKDRPFRYVITLRKRATQPNG